MKMQEKDRFNQVDKEGCLQHGGGYKDIVLFSPAVGTFNLGDKIILSAIQKELDDILANNFVMEVPTHFTPFNSLQILRDYRAKWVEKADYKFICGTDLLTNNMLHPINQLNIQLLTSKPFRNSILLGVGNSTVKEKTNYYTKRIYNNILSKDYLHSVRDAETQKTLKKFGFDSIVTGCPTLWGLTNEFCAKIPAEKSDNCVFTLTGSNRKINRDQEMISIIKSMYKKVYFWIQTIWDYEYFKGFQGIEGIKILPPDLNIFSKFLSVNDIDYIGTRLHGGIFAMQHKKRTVIVCIDSRSRDINYVNNLNVIERENISDLKHLITNKIVTNVKINYDAIDKWKKQFA